MKKSNILNVFIKAGADVKLIPRDIYIELFKSLTEFPANWIKIINNGLDLT
jgi:hypothetical protein